MGLTPASCGKTSGLSGLVGGGKHTVGTPGVNCRGVVNIGCVIRDDLNQVEGADKNYHSLGIWSTKQMMVVRIVYVDGL